MLPAQHTTPPSSAKSKASRLLGARNMARLTRKDIEQQYGISENTIRMWERPRTDSFGLTKKGANRIVKALKQSGVVCSIEWLMEGAGTGPKLYEEMVSDVITPIKKLIDIPKVTWGKEEIIQKEIECFYSLHPNAVIIKILDDGMAPYLMMGDYVGGEKCMGDDIEHCIGKICIVNMHNNNSICRQLVKSSHNASYNLVCSNPVTEAKEPVIYDANLNYVSEVIWIRKAN